MLWSDYLKIILEQETVLDNLSLSLCGESNISVPSIVKASVLLADKLAAISGKHLFVFPEHKYCTFTFMLLRTLYNISEGRIKKKYDPYSFSPREKLKFKNSVVEFLEIRRFEDGIERICVRLVDMTMFGMPLSAAPYLQHVQTKRLSKYDSFHKDYAPFREEQKSGISKAFIRQLSDYKTHLDASVLFVAPMISSKKLLMESCIGDEKISDILLLAQADYDGRIKNMTAGQLSGIPAIILCHDLYTAVDVINTENEVKSIFVEATQAGIDSQLDALDDLVRPNLSITLLADQTSISEYSNLEVRGFNIWTWNDKTISRDLYRAGASRIDVRTANSLHKTIIYEELCCSEISDAISLLYKNKKIIDEQSPLIIQVFQDLFEMALLSLRAISPLMNSGHTLNILKKDKDKLLSEKGYIRKELFADLNRVIENLSVVFAQGFILPKAASIVTMANESTAVQVFVVVAQNTNKGEVEQYLNSIPRNEDITLAVLNVNEYLAQDAHKNGITIVSGWLNKSIMNKILNANITSKISVLLYEAETRWKNGYARAEKEKYRRSNTLNSTIVSQISDELGADIDNTDSDIPVSEYLNGTYVADADELDEIELTLRQNKYRSYISPTGTDSVSVVPVSFVGDLIAFYRINHTLLTATKLINEDYDKIEEVKPSDVQTGDFIIERETQRDLIRDIADVILKNSNCLDLRETARKWKEALEVESIFSDEDTICMKLKAAGCTRGKMTIHNWLTDDGMITPLSKDDIGHIARATEDSVLLEMVDAVFEAGKTIKSAHIQAGHHLAEKLKANMATAISEIDDIDGFNIWKPIEIDIEGIGIVNLLKVIDVGTEVLVDAASTNRLIDTNRTMM